MKKQKRDSSAPWVVDTEHILTWIKKGMPIRYKMKTCYLTAVKTEKVMIFNVKSNKFLHVDAENITLLM